MTQVKLSIILIILSNYIHAQPPLQSFSIYSIYADQVKIDQISHKGEYIGNVKINNDLTHLTAEKAIIISNDKNQITFAIAISQQNNNLAHYWTKSAIDNPYLHAYANILKYYPKQHLIKLIGNARIVQGDNVFTATTIDCNTLTQHIVAKGNKDAAVYIYLSKH